MELKFGEIILNLDNIEVVPLVVKKTLVCMEGAIFHGYSCI
jgi:hypothetical protein